MAGNTKRSQGPVIHKPGPGPGPCGWWGLRSPVNQAAEERPFAVAIDNTHTNGYGKIMPKPCDEALLHELSDQNDKNECFK